MRSTAQFADEKLKKAYKELKNSKTDDKELYKWVSRAIIDLKKTLSAESRYLKG